MWPADHTSEQEDMSSSSSRSPSPFPTTTTSNTVVDSSSAVTGELMVATGRSSTPTHNRPIQVAHMAYYPIVLSRQLDQMQSELVAQDTGGESTALVALSGATTGGHHNVIHLSPQSGGGQYCCKCSVKDMELIQLRKRIKTLEEELCKTGTCKLTVIDQSPSLAGGPTLVQVTSPIVQPVSNINFQGMRPVVSQVRSESFTTPTHTILVPANRPIQPPPTVLTNSTTTIETPQAIGGSVSPSNESPSNSRDDDSIELVPGTGVYISTARLQQILSIVKTGKQLARKLMSVYWDRMILAKSTLSAASQHYQQLDPKTVSAIKTYCVLFDSTARKSEIHSTMIDKCVQARRPRRSSLKVHIENSKYNKQESSNQPEIINILTPVPPQTYLYTSQLSNDSLQSATGHVTPSTNQSNSDQEEEEEDEEEREEILIDLPNNNS